VHPDRFPQNTYAVAHSNYFFSATRSKTCDEEEIKKSQTCLEKFVALFDFYILLDPIFVHIMIGLSLAYTTSISFSTFFPLFLREDLDMTVIDASTCMSVLSLMDFIGRIVIPLITKRIDITHRTTFIVGSFLLAASRSSTTYFSSLGL
jgi:sugar phosphate permease